MDKDLEEAFFAGRRSKALPFVVNDPVQIVTGPHVGLGGAVISPVLSGSGLRYLVELGESPFGDVTVPAQWLELAIIDPVLDQPGKEPSR